jgi:dTDP-4-dehydrorhamnose reductase
VRILVTGVSGQVGSAIVRSFRDLGAVIPADRATLDLAKPHEIMHKLNELNPDVIVNPAAYTAVDRAEDERDLAFAVNAAGPEALARWAAARHVPLIHFSTDYVFDGSGKKPWRENDPTGPLSVYGASKLAGEVAVQSAAGPHLIIRTAWVYSANGINFVRTIARLARERKELRVVGDQIGSPTSAAYIAGALAEIFRANIADLPQAFVSAANLIHLTAGGHTSWHGFASAIVNGLRRRGVPIATERVIEIATKDYPTKAARPLNSSLDLSRLTQVFKITPQPWYVLLEEELDRLERRPLGG